MSYYKNVKRNHINLDEAQEKEILRDLSNLRAEMYRKIFSFPGVIAIILDDLSRRTSKAGTTRKFNSNARGNNKRVERFIEKVISQVKASSVMADKIKILIECDFREEWVLTEIVPKAEMEPPLDILKQIEEKEAILVRSCLKLAVGLASATRGHIELDDAIQQANLALIDAVKKYNPARGTRFVTYAHQKIRWRLRLDQWENPRDIIRIPRNRPKSSRAPWLSLDEEKDCFIRNRKIRDMLPGPGRSSESEVEESMARSKLRKEIVKVLNSNELEIIRLRYLSGRVLTYEEVRQSITSPMSKQRISQLETVALRKLRNSGLLKELYEVFKQ